VSRRIPALSHPKLPCFPCPHQAACCAYGTSITSDEYAALAPAHGSDSFRWDEEEEGWRTVVRNGHCVFLLPDSSCSLHGDAHYPVVCRGFPDVQPETGGPYLGDLTICPELAG